jgi:hypothetical protein
MNEWIPGVLPVAAAKIRALPPLDDFLTFFSSWVVICGVLVILVVWLSDCTDAPFIDHLPSVRGFPIVGNLIQLGTEQPRRLAELSEKHGPVFQIRLGNKASLSHIVDQGVTFDVVPAICCCKQLRVHQATLDQQPI